MTWIDISWPIETGMLTYEGDPPVVSRICSTAVAGKPDSYNLTLLSLSSHAGTHVDAPRHFLPQGLGIDEIPLDTFVGPAQVVDLSSGPRAIDRATLEAQGVSGAARVLLKTSNVELFGQPFSRDYAHLTVDGALWLRDQQVRLVGIDYLSIEAPHSAGFPVHHTLLGASPPVVIVEGLDLRRVAAGSYELCVLPLRLAGGDGAPARAMVRAPS